MRLLIYELPPMPTPEGNFERRTLRHWLTLDDGTLWYQDEYLTLINEWESTRDDWIQLPTPPAQPRVIGFIDHGGLPLAMRSDGQSFIYGREIGAPEGERWVPFLSPVPLND
jgi:hypothetical protein